MSLYNFNLQSIVGRISRLSNGSQVAVRGTSAGSFSVAQVESRHGELCRSGMLFVASCGVIGNALGALQTVADVPTTATGTLLYNKTVTPGLCLEILAISAHQSSGTPALNAGLMVSTPGTVTANPTANATGGVISNCSGSVKGSNAWIDTGKTFSAAQAWMDVAGNQQSATAGVGSSLICWLDGAIIVRAGQAVGANVLSGIGTNHKWGINFLFAQREMDIED